VTSALTVRLDRRSASEIVTATEDPYRARLAIETNLSRIASIMD